MIRPYKFIFISFLAVLCAMVLFYSSIIYALHRRNVDGLQSKTIVIDRGLGVSEIAKKLREENLINSSTLFAIYVKFNKISLQAGTYSIGSNLSIVEVSNLLQHGVDEVSVTLVEGLRSEEIAQYLAGSLPNFKKEKFLEEVRSKKLEGKLFPDTYKFNRDATYEDVLDRLIETFKLKTSEVFKANKTSLTDDEVLILASIVEREESLDQERPVVAGILMKRLKNGELVGADATVQYAIGKEGDFWPKTITAEDLNTDSPFNTRKYPGLPPHPISNPGLSAIVAVTNFKESPYLFYLHDKNGKVHFSVNLEEHVRNTLRYLN